MSNQANTLPNNVEKYLRQACALLIDEGREDCATLVVNAKPVVMDGGYDDWNGGQDYFDLSLYVPMSLYLGNRAKRKDREEKLLEVLNEVSNPDAPNEHWRNITIALSDIDDNQWRENSGMLIHASQRIVSNEAQNRIWRPGYPIRALISYRETNKAQVGELAKSLDRFGISAFAAHRDIDNGTEWPTELVNALSTMDVLIPVLTDDFRGSSWTDQEVGWAFGAGKKVIPVNVGTVPYGFMGSTQCRLMDWKQIPRYVFEQCRGHKKWSDCLIKAVALCPNFDVANTVLWPYVSGIKNLTNQQINSLVEAANGNKQISYSAGFSGPKMTGAPFRELLDRLSDKKWLFKDSCWCLAGLSTPDTDMPF